MMLLSIWLFTSAATPTVPTGELRQLAEAHTQARRYVEAGETYLSLAHRPEVRVRDELYNAHMSFENAYRSGSGVQHLCRALRLAEKVVTDGVFDDQDQGVFWGEIVDLDLTELAKDATTNHRTNCRFDATGRKRAPVLLLADADFPSETGPTAERQQAPSPSVSPPQRPTTVDRRRRASTAAGATLTGLGAGLLGSMALALAGQRRDAAMMSAMIDHAQAAGRDFAVREQTRFERLYDDARLLRSAALGLGITGAATLTTGIALLSTRGRILRRAVAFRPYGGLLGAGATFRLEF